MSKNRENLYKISNGLYLVTTQAGFNKCVKILSREGYNKGFPKSYPSVVSSYDYYEGCFITFFYVHQ